MINLQQYYLEERLVQACEASQLVDLRWKHKLLALQLHDDHAAMTVETPDGIFKMKAQWVVAADGANSDSRRMVGADFTGQFFQDRFLIADVVMKAHFPTERWFWFDPPFHRNQSVLLHKECDNVWRIDFQLGWDADPEEEKKPSWFNSIASFFKKNGSIKETKTPLIQNTNTTRPANPNKTQKQIQFQSPKLSFGGNKQNYTRKNNKIKELEIKNRITHKLRRITHKLHKITHKLLN